MTLQELKDQGVFGSHLSDKNIIKLCKNLKIPGINDSSTLASTIDERFVDRIKTSTDLNRIKLKYDMIDLHDDVIKKYDDLISRYTAIRDSINGKAEFTNEFNELNRIITDIQNQKNDYRNHIVNTDRNKMTDFLNHNFTEQRTSNKIINKIHSIGDFNLNSTIENTNRVDKKLRKLYVDQNRFASYSSKNVFLRAKMNRVTRKIHRLQNKKGKIEDNQRKIVTNSTTRYINKMNNRFDAFYKELEKFEQAIDIKQKNIDRKNELEQEKRELENEIRRSGRVGKAVLGLSRKNVEKEIERLNKKHCTVDLSQQYSYIFEHSYAR